MKSAQSIRWLATPQFDLALLVLTPVLIVPAAFLILQGGFTEPRQFAAWVFALGAQGHHLPGWLRAYGDRTVFDTYRNRLLLAPPAIVGLCLLFAWFELHGLVLAAYAWGVWHGLMQTYGVARLYGRFEGDNPRRARADLLLCQVGFIAAVFASELRRHYILDLAARLGFEVPPAAWIEGLGSLAYASVFGVLVFWIWVQWATRHDQPHHPARLLVLGTSLAFWWLCNLSVSHMLIGVALFEIFHDVQYLSLVWWVGRKRHADGAGGTAAAWLYSRGARSVAIYVGVCLLYGTLSAPGEAGLSLIHI